MLQISSNDAYIRHQQSAALIMRTTIVIDDALLAKATELSGLHERTAVIRESLKALIERESARRLAKLGGSEPQLELVSRRRSEQ